MLEVDELVVRLDTTTRQVLIEAKLVETSSNPRTSKGIDWTSTLQAQNLTFGNNAQRSLSPNTPSTPGGGGPGTIAPAPLGGLLQDPSKFIVSTSGGLTPYTAFLNADGVKATLSFLNNDSDAQVLSTPRAVTLDNQEAILSVTRAQPIFKNTAGTQGSPGGSEVTYTNLGTILKVTPRISANDFINLRVVPEVSSVFETVTKTVAGQTSQADSYDIRRIETQVLIPSGNTLVMGGLVKNNSNKSYTKVPLLGDLPLIGLAFRKESKSREKNNLIIFITPSIVGDDDYQVAKSDFLKTTFVEQPDPKISAWDSGKPLDWSKTVVRDDKTTTHEQNLKN
jgi:general secretion pathway protein D